MRRPFPTSFLTLLVVVAFGCSVSAEPLGTAAPPESIDLPGGNRLALPPGTHAFGPAGPLTSPRVSQKATLLQAPAIAPGERRRRTLDELYDRLAQAKDAVEAGAIASKIAQTQEVSASDTANLLMQRAAQALSGGDTSAALLLLDKLILLQPNWAEAWNRRATVRFLNNDDVGSMEDIGHVLVLQPRHFGALSGMGMILQRNGDDRAAMAVFRKAEALNPRDASVKASIEQLRPAVDGTEL